MKRRIAKDERGISLIVALLALLVLSTLATSLIFVTQTETWTSANFKFLTQARYAAEAGTQNTSNWLNYTYPAPSNMAVFDTTKFPVQYNNAPVILSAMSGVSSNYPDSTVVSAYSAALGNQSLPGLANASYSTYATLLSMNPTGMGVSWLPGSNGGTVQTWQITSQGSVASLRNATVQVVATYKRTGTPLLPFAIAATGTVCKAIDFSSSSYTDSFDSSAGTYAATVQTTGGNVGLNGNINLSGSAKIGGTISALNTNLGSCPSNGITSSSSASPINQGTVTLTTALSYPTPSSPSPTPPTTNQNSSGTCPSSIPAGCTQPSSNNIALSPNYQYGNISLSGGSTVLHLSAGTYNINSLNMSGGSQLQLDSYPVILNIAGTSASTALNLSGGSVSNPSGIPANFQVVYGGSAGITLSGGSGSYGVVYAPNSPITMSGGSGWYGAIVGRTATDSGGSPVHYDRALGNSLQQLGAFRLIGFSWSKF